MIYAKTQPIGVDKVIYRFQEKLEAMGWSDTAIYGRLHMNMRENSRIAEAYLSKGEYTEIFTDDKHGAVFGFIVEEDRTGLSFIQTQVRMICSVNLDEIFTSDERMDEEAILRVIKAVTPLIMSDRERIIETGLENVYEGLDTERFKFRNMHPWFNFSLAFDVSYTNDICDIMNNSVKTF